MLRALGVLSVLETLTVLVLLGNLATVHADGITSAVGPVHGALYLTVAVTALLGRDLLPRTRVLALVPVVGGVLTLRNLRREARR